MMEPNKNQSLEHPLRKEKKKVPVEFVVRPSSDLR